MFSSISYSFSNNVIPLINKSSYYYNLGFYLYYVFLGGADLSLNLGDYYDYFDYFYFSIISLKFSKY